MHCNGVDAASLQSSWQLLCITGAWEEPCPRTAALPAHAGRHWAPLAEGLGGAGSCGVAAGSCGAASGGTCRASALSEGVLAAPAGSN